MMENRRIDLSVGDIVFIPRSAVHYFVNTASEPTVAFVVFSPPFDGKDTVPAKSRKPFVSHFPFIIWFKQLYLVEKFNAVNVYRMPSQ